MPKVLDLFSGLEGWSAPYRSAGWGVTTLDNDARFGADIQSDILSVPDGIGQGFDAILASPPCTCFTTMSFKHHWKPGRVPRTADAFRSLEIVKKTVRIIEASGAKFWVIENPRAMLRKLDLIPYRRETVWYCQYGEQRAKPTDLWGGFPKGWTPRRQCRNGARDHIAAPRGSRTGTQGGLDSASSAKIPYLLAESLRRAMEREL